MITKVETDAHEELLNEAYQRFFDVGILGGRRSGPSLGLGKVHFGPMAAISIPCSGHGVQPHSFGGPK